MHFISASCRGENCGICHRIGGTKTPATHKVEEDPLDDPSIKHPLTQYVCCDHFGFIMGPHAISISGCPE